MNFDITQYSYCFPDRNGIIKWEHYPKVSGTYFNAEIANNNIQALSVYRDINKLSHFDFPEMVKGQLIAIETHRTLFFKYKSGPHTMKFLITLINDETLEKLKHLLTFNNILVLNANPNTSSQETLVNRPSSFGSMSMVSVKSTKPSSQPFKENLQVTHMVAKSIEQKETLNFKVQMYCYGYPQARANRENRGKGSDTSVKMKWTHLGLTSDLILSLVPSDQRQNPIILLTHKEKYLETIVPSSSHLKSFTSGQFLYLKTKQASKHQIKHIQLQFFHTKDTEICAEWLYQLECEVNYPQDIDTDITKLSSGWGPRGLNIGSASSASFGMSTSSAFSLNSRSSRFWTRRRHQLGLL